MSYKSGDTIQLSDEQKELVKSDVEFINDMGNAFRLASRYERLGNERLWKTLREMYPDVEDWEAHYNAETGCIILRFPKSE